MVECESRKHCFTLCDECSFNRYMVECEWLSTTSVCDKTMVLIDTWWNVNNCSLNVFLACVCSFNRYMVECESIDFRKGRWKNFVLIDTWWNVNNVWYAGRYSRKCVLIDTWWNVNIFASSSRVLSRRTF